MEKKLSPEECTKMIREMQRSKLNASEMLPKLAQIRRSIPGVDAAPRTKRIEDGRSMLPDGFPAETEEDFEAAAMMDALELIIEDIAAMRVRQNVLIVEKWMQIYYAVEEAARDPKNAHLIPHVEAMRRAYERQFGTPVPPRDRGGSGPPDGE